MQDMCRDIPTYGLLYMGYRNPLRRLCINLHKSAAFNGFVLATIIANCVTLAMTSSEPGFSLTQTGVALNVMDYIFTSIFLMEMAVKITALDFVGSPGSYIREPWNILDFVVVTLSVMSWIPGVSAGSGEAP